MKQESFKFQDGKVFWLPEYPEMPTFQCTSFSGGPCTVHSSCRCMELQRNYEKIIAQSLASAIEVAPEDEDKIFKLLWWQDDMKPGSTEDFQLENGKVYSAECEMETLVIECDDCKETHTHCFNKRCPYKNQVARLKPKDVEIDDAYLNLIIEHHRDRIKWHQSRIDYLQNDPAANSQDMKDDDL